MMVNGGVDGGMPASHQPTFLSSTFADGSSCQLLFSSAAMSRHHQARVGQSNHQATASSPRLVRANHAARWPWPGSTPERDETWLSDMFFLSPSSTRSSIRRTGADETIVSASSRSRATSTFRTSCQEWEISRQQACGARARAMDSKSASCHSSTTCSTSRECRDGYGPPSSIRWTTPSHSDVCSLLALAPPLSPQVRVLSLSLVTSCQRLTNTPLASRHPRRVFVSRWLFPQGERQASRQQKLKTSKKTSLDC